MEIIRMKLSWNRLIEFFKFDLSYDPRREGERIKRQKSKIREAKRLLEKLDVAGDKDNPVNIDDYFTRKKIKEALQFTTFPHGFLRKKLQCELSSEGIDVRCETMNKGTLVISLHTTNGYVAMQQPVGKISNFIKHPGRLI